MIYVEVLCTSGNEDDPFPSKQFQPTLRQTRYRMFVKVSDVCYWLTFNFPVLDPHVLLGYFAFSAPSYIVC